MALPTDQNWREPDKQVDSSAIAEIGYNADAGDLYVTFNSGRRYVYSGVSPQRYRAFATAESKGKYLNSAIKNVYPYRKLG